MDGVIGAMVAIWLLAVGASVWVVKRGLHRFEADCERTIEYRTAPMRKDLAKLRERNERLENEKRWGFAKLRDAEAALLAAQKHASAEVELLEDPPPLPRKAKHCKKPRKFRQ